MMKEHFDDYLQYYLIVGGAFACGGYFDTGLSTLFYGGLVAIICGFFRAIARA